MNKMIIAIGVYLCGCFLTHGENMLVPVAYVRASSSLPDNPGEPDTSLLKRVRYCGDKAFDRRADTVWAEGAEGPGLNESVVVRFEREIRIDEIEVMPGYFDARYFKANNRIKRFRLEASGANGKEIFYCPDVREAQRLRLSKPVATEEIVFTILEVYPGDKWNDTCLSELAFFSRGSRYELRCNRIVYSGGNYSLSLDNEPLDLFPRGEGGGPVASIVLNSDGTVSGDFGPGSQVGMPIIEGSWRFQSDCTIRLNYTYGVGRKLMGIEEGENDNPYSREVTETMVLLVLGENQIERESWFGGSAEFLCIVISRAPE